MSRIRSISPSEKQEQVEKLKQERQAARANLERAINVLAGMPEGRIFFTHLAAACGFGSSKVVMQRSPTGEIVAMEAATLYNCARESVYINEVREYLNKSNRSNIERNL